MKYQNKLIFSAAITATLFIWSSSISAADLPNINADKTEISSIDALVDSSTNWDCIDLEISGICMYIVIRVNVCAAVPPVCVEVLPEFSIRLAHHNPDLLVASYGRLGGSPLDVSNLVYDKLQLAVAKPILEIISGEDVPATFDDPEVWASAGSESTKQYKSTLSFNEVDVIGHPGNVLSHAWPTLQGDSQFVNFIPAAAEGLIDSVAEIPNQVLGAADMIVNPGAEDIVTEMSVDPDRWADYPLDTSLNYLADNTFVNSVAEIANLIGAMEGAVEGVEEATAFFEDGLGGLGDSIQTATDTLDDVQDVLDTVESIGGGLGGSGESAPLLTKYPAMSCPSSAEMLKPYFLSGANIIQWRYNIPELVYPHTYMTSLVPSWRKHFIGNETHPDDPDTLNFWGPLFPRNGYVLQADRMKAAAVTASRAVHVATRDYTEGVNQIHVYSPMRVTTDYGDGFKMVEHPAPYDLNDTDTGKWELMGPSGDGNCIRFGEGDMIPGEIVAPNALTGESELVEKDEVPWTYGKESDDNSYVFTLWRKYECCPTPMKDGSDIFFYYFDLIEIDLGPFEIL